MPDGHSEHVFLPVYLIYICLLLILIKYIHCQFRLQDFLDGTCKINNFSRSFLIFPEVVEQKLLIFSLQHKFSWKLFTWKYLDIFFRTRGIYSYTGIMLLHYILIVHFCKLSNISKQGQTWDAKSQIVVNKIVQVCNWKHT